MQTTKPAKPATSPKTAPVAPVTAAPAQAVTAAPAQAVTAAPAQAVAPVTAAPAQAVAPVAPVATVAAVAPTTVALPITARGSSAVPLTPAQITALQAATVASIAHYLAVGFGSSAVQPKPYKANGACGAVWAMVQAAHQVLGVHATTAQLVQLGASFTPPLNAGNVKIEASRAKKHFALLAAQANA